ncbi:MAG: S1-like domain-containing RNA-binding protein [Bacteroidota bacterium]|nr:S1-like domain-containing RNA-binding protein [Bacteroidota bacterium]
MLEIGKYNTLKVLRLTPPGAFLGNAEGEEVLLPNKYVPKGIRVDEELEVFVYLDYEERLVATTIKPYTSLNQFAYLEVVDLSRAGAFMYWGLEKDLFVPFQEQVSKMRVGQSYLVYVYLDKSSGRLAASERINRFLKNEELSIEEGQEVDLIIASKSDLGFNVVVNEQHLGLVYFDDIYIAIETGDKIKGYIKKIRDDHKIDVTLRPMGYRNIIEPSAQLILDTIKKKGGILKLTDNSHPDEIKALLGMSKKNFKKTIGALYKQKLILLKEDGVYLNQ